MAETKYDYVTSVNFPSRKADLDRLSEEIRGSSIVTALSRIETAGDTCSIWFKAALDAGDVAVLDTIVAAHTGMPLDPLPDTVKLLSPANPQDHVLLVASAPREGSEVIYATHNLCDRTTWYSQSARATDEALTDSGDGLTWAGANVNWIDLYSGRLMDDDGVREDAAHGYAVVVTVDGAEQTMREPYESSGGDFAVDFAAGSITFFASQTGKTVLATYSYENGATWVLAPTSGTALDVESAEAQFSADIVANDTLRFSIHGYAAVFAPAAVAGGLLGPTDLVELGRDRYKRITQLIDQAMGAFPVIPPIGGAERGTTKAIYGFPFRYGTLRRLYSSYGMELRVTLEHGRPFGGEYATATFYCVSRAEAGVLP